MAYEPHPHLDALADFMVFSNFRERFEPPLYLQPNPNEANRFALIPEVARWLGIPPETIELCPRDISNADPLGMIEMLSNGGARISYSIELNPCWKRLIVVKELCHLIVEKLEYKSLPPIDIPSLLSSVCRPDATNLLDCYDTENQNGATELNCCYLAEQILVPWFANPEIISSERTDYDEAFIYRAPRDIIATRRNNRDGVSHRVAEAVNRRLESMPSTA